MGRYLAHGVNDNINIGHMPDANENCQEDDGFCAQCQEKRNSTCSLRQHKSDLAASVQLLTRHGSKDSLPRKGGGRKAGKVDRGQVRLGLIGKLYSSHICPALQAISCLAAWCAPDSINASLQ